MLCFTFSLKFDETVFVSSVISSHVIAESLIILVKHLSFLHLHVARFQIYAFSLA